MERDFPLFPLGIVALPTEVVPLHIFEERYKAMIGQCLENGAEFGIVWLSDEELKGTGCAVQVDRVLERFDDGRLYIVCVGTRPFRLVERQARRLVLDLSKLRFLDSAGLALIIAQHRRAQQDGTEFAITNAYGEVRRVLAVSGVDRVLASA